jgi:hypothetical protein
MEEINQRHYTLKIERALQGRGTESTSQPQSTHPPSKTIINITAIGAVAFHQYTRKKDATIFLSSLHELNKLINKKQDKQPLSLPQQLTIAAQSLTSQSTNHSPAITEDEIGEIKQVLPEPY